MWSVKLDDLYNSIKNADLFIMILAFSIGIPTVFISTVKWKLLLKAQSICKPNFMRLWALYYIGTFFCNFLPTEVGGDLYRSYDVGKTTGKHAESLAAVTMERITGFSAIILLATAGLFINWSLANELHLIFIVSCSFGIGVVALCLLFNSGFIKWIKRKMDCSYLRKVLEKLQSFYTVLTFYKKNTYVLIQAMVISFLFQMLVILFVYVLLICLNIEFSFLQLILIVPVISLTGIIPITINSIGLREGAFVYIFTHMGVSPSQSFALALLFRIGSLIPSMIGVCLYIFGIIYYKDSKHIPHPLKREKIEEKGSVSYGNL
jgi:hypothetical protein